jgi:alanyl-tRNA synthetase
VKSVRRDGVTMTERLYFDDSYCIEFDATVASVAQHDGRTTVVLDRTAFYPTSGGQPFDRGTLGGLPVVDVVEDEAGTIAHAVDGVLTVGQTAHGRIDWARRFDHMQQHTGQHLLSAAFDRRFGARTIGFHLGEGASTIDLDRTLGPDDIAVSEGDANRVVWEDRVVRIRSATAEQAARLPLRKDSGRQGALRLVEVDGFDLSACGGTHVARCGAVGVVAIRSWERFKGGERIEFLCGGRALAAFRSLRDVVATGGRLLSVAADDLTASIERLQVEVKDRRRAIAALERDLVRYRADELAASAEPTAVGRLVMRAIDADAIGLKTLATAIAAKANHAAVLVSTRSPFLVVVARSESCAVQADGVLATLVAAFGGRGGGKPDVAQGGGLDGTTGAILQAARIAIVE